MIQNEYPPGWNEEKVRDLIASYDSQTEDEAVAEFEAGLNPSTESELDRTEETSKRRRAAGVKRSRPRSSDSP
jgi:hypothetical protein